MGYGLAYPRDASELLDLCKLNACSDVWDGDFIDQRSSLPMTIAYQQKTHSIRVISWLGKNSPSRAAMNFDILREISRPKVTNETKVLSQKESSTQFRGRHFKITKNKPFIEKISANKILNCWDLGDQMGVWVEWMGPRPLLWYLTMFLHSSGCTHKRH